MHRHRSVLRVAEIARALFGLALALALGAQAPRAEGAEPIAVPCSPSALVSAITTANAGPGAVTLDLAPGCTYTLTLADNVGTNGRNGLPVITGDVTINGHGAVIERDNLRSFTTSALIADGWGFRLFEVAPGATLRLRQVTVRGGGPGRFPVDGGGIYNAGTLELDNATVSDNAATRGGGIFNAGTLLMQDSTLSDNLAVGDSATYPAPVVTMLRPSCAETSNHLIISGTLMTGTYQGSLRLRASVSAPDITSSYMTVVMTAGVSTFDVVTPAGRVGSGSVRFTGTLADVEKALSTPKPELAGIGPDAAFRLRRTHSTASETMNIMVCDRVGRCWSRTWIVTANLGDSADCAE